MGPNLIGEQKKNKKKTEVRPRNGHVEHVHNFRVYF